MQIEVDYKRVGDRIRAAREEKNYTQSQLGALCGCSNNHLSHLETGLSKPSLTMLLRLSHALDKDLNYFILDTTYAVPNYVINAEIAEKLNRCDSSTLVVVSDMIDLLLKQQEVLKTKFLLDE